MNSLFQDLPIISTDDIDEARSFISHELTEMRFKEIKDTNSFSFRMNTVQLGQTLIGYEAFDTKIVVDVGEVADALVVVFGVGPATIIDIDREPIGVYREWGDCISQEAVECSLEKKCR